MLPFNRKLNNRTFMPSKSQLSGHDSMPQLGRENRRQLKCRRSGFTSSQFVFEALNWAVATFALVTLAGGVAQGAAPSSSRISTLEICGCHFSEHRFSILVETCAPSRALGVAEIPDRVNCGWLVVFERESRRHSFKTAKCYGPLYSRDGQFGRLTLADSVHGNFVDRSSRHIENAALRPDGAVWQYRISHDHAVVSRYELAFDQDKAKWMKRGEYKRSATGVLQALQRSNGLLPYSDTGRYLVFFADNKASVFDAAQGSTVAVPWLQRAYPALQALEGKEYSSYFDSDLSQLVCLPRSTLTMKPGNGQGLNTIGGIRLREPFQGVVWSSNSNGPATFDYPPTLIDFPCRKVVFLNDGPHLLVGTDKDVWLGRIGSPNGIKTPLPPDRFAAGRLHDAEADPRTGMLYWFQPMLNGEASSSPSDSLRVFEWEFARNQVKETTVDLRGLFKYERELLQPSNFVEVK